MARTVAGELSEGAISGAMAADQLYRLGVQYAAGRDVERDLVQAHKWFNLAAMRGFAPALGERQALALEMSRAQIAEAQKQAREVLARPN